MIAIRINGKNSDVSPGLTVDALVRCRTIRPKSVAVALNGSVVVPDQWKRTILRDGDAVEIFSFFYGG